MTGAWDDLGGRRETYAEALARSLVGKTDAAPTEQELAAKIVADRERMKMHDAILADNYLTVSEQVVVSRTLAKMLGYAPHDNSLADDDAGWSGTDD